MSEHELIVVGVFVAKLTAWCLAPFAALLWTRHRSAAERHALVLATLVGALLLPFADAALPRLGPGFVDRPAPALPASSLAADERAPRASWESAHAPLPRETVRSTNRSAPTGASLTTPALRAAEPSTARRIDPATGSKGPTSEPVIRLQPATVLFALWVLGTLLSFAQIALRWFQLRALVRRSTPIADDAPRRLLAELADEVGLKSLPELLESTEITVPIAVDPFATPSTSQRAIVLPAAWRNAPPEALRTALLHELAHLSRRDGSSTLTGALSVACYWWHPLVRRLASWARQEAEKAADDVVLLHGESPTGYADHLLYFARTARAQPTLGVPLMSSNRSDLKSRVLSILDSERRRQPMGRRWLVPIGALLLLVAPLSGLRIIADSEASLGDLGVLRLGPAPIDISPISSERVEQSAPRRLAQRSHSHEARPDWSHDDAHEKKKKKKESTEYSRAYDLYHDKKFSEAAAAFAAAGDAGEKTATSYYNAACSAALAEEPEAALSYLQRSIDAGWDDPEHIVEDSDLDSLRSDARFQGIVDSLYESIGEARPPIEGYRLRMVEERYKFLNDSASDDGKAWYKNGTALLSLRKIEDAEYALERAVELLGPRAESALYNLACLYAVSGRTEAALDALNRSIEAGFSDIDHLRSDHDLRALRGTEGFARLERLAEALDLDRFREWPKELADGSWETMKSEYERGRWNEAIDFYRQFTGDNPEIGRGWYNLGWALHHARRFAEAAEPFERAAANGYSPANAAYNIACGHALRNETEDAFSWLEIALDRGFRSVGTLQEDDDLASLRSDPRLQRMIWQLEESSRY